MAFLEDQFGEWKPVSRGAGIAWLCFYALFLLYAYLDRSGFLVLDYVNLIIHEGGHFFFSWFGETMHILGGTPGELIVPLLSAVYFFCQRETTGFAFSCFWFFENFPYIGTYMATPGQALCPWWVQTRAIGRFSSASGACLPRIKRSVPPCTSSAGSACSPPSPGWPIASAKTPRQSRIPYPSRLLKNSDLSILRAWFGGPSFSFDINPYVQEVTYKGVTGGHGLSRAVNAAQSTWL